ncbi:MAG: hypothetical protein EKK29_07035 [Hyphomicrobiales bacterium]|nr:MAG: hypothetical protein EKK29_07035 [Hyphomicrobiales bacterium]
MLENTEIKSELKLVRTKTIKVLACYLPRVHLLMVSDEDTMAATKKLPEFNADIGPESARHFRAEALSRRLMEQIERNTGEHKELLARNPAIRDAFVRENVRTSKREPTLADRMLAEVEGDGEPQAEESRPVGPSDAERDALGGSRELNASWQEINDALHELGDKQLWWHSKSCREYCEKIRSEHYAPLATEVAKKILELAHAIDRHDSFTGELHRMGVTAQSNLLMLELPRWRHILRALNSAVEHNYIDKSAIPETWRQK